MALVIFGPVSKQDRDNLEKNTVLSDNLKPCSNAIKGHFKNNVLYAI